MACHIQIGDDLTIWRSSSQFQPSQLTQPLNVLTWYPIHGDLALSTRKGRPRGHLHSCLPFWYRHLWIFPEESSMCRPRPVRPQDTSGMSWGIPSTRDVLAGQIQALMRNGQSQTITSAAQAGTLVLDGATLPFAVTGPGAFGGPTPHG